MNNGISSFSNWITKPTPTTEVRFSDDKKVENRLGEGGELAKGWGWC